MTFECIGLTGFAGDRTVEAMEECHQFTKSFANHFAFAYQCIGTKQPSIDLPWNQALSKSKTLFDLAIEHVQRVFDAKRYPILITPRCATAIATLPVVLNNYPEAVVVYFDAHGDLHTPESSESGYLGGMPIAAALGEWDSGYGSGLRSDRLVHIGGRDLDRYEQEFIKRKNIFTIKTQDFAGDLSEFANFINGKPVFVHLDTDVYDPSEVSAEYAVDKGLFREDVAQIIGLITDNAQLIGLEITELSPKSDEQRRHSYHALYESFSCLKHLL